MRGSGYVPPEPRYCPPEVALDAGSGYISVDVGAKPTESPESQAERIKFCQSAWPSDVRPALYAARHGNPCGRPADPVWVEADLEAERLATGPPWVAACGVVIRRNLQGVDHR